jgi:hypothetical protein
MLGTANPWPEQNVQDWSKNKVLQEKIGHVRSSSTFSLANGFPRQIGSPNNPSLICEFSGNDFWFWTVPSGGQL